MSERDASTPGLGYDLYDLNYLASPFSRFGLMDWCERKGVARRLVLDEGALIPDMDPAPVQENLTNLPNTAE